MKPVFTIKWVGALQPFWLVYVSDILLIRNDVEFSGKHKGVFEKSFSKKDLDEATYTLSFKIYWDRSRCLISFFNEYIPWQDFEVVQNGTVKEGVLACVCLCCKVWSWVKTQKKNSTTTENRKRMKSHSLCLGHRFYKVCYVVYQTYCVPHHEFGKRVQ